MNYIEVIPAKQSVSRGESLNLLGGVANDGDAIILDISVWGRVDREWVALDTQRTELAAHEHRHLYFTLETDCFSSERWHEEIEEIELLIRDKRPGEGDRGRIVFIE